MKSRIQSKVVSLPAKVTVMVSPIDGNADRDLVGGKDLVKDTRHHAAVEIVAQLASLRDGNHVALSCRLAAMMI